MNIKSTASFSLYFKRFLAKMRKNQISLDFIISWYIVVFRRFEQSICFRKLLIPMELAFWWSLKQPIFLTSTDAMHFFTLCKRCTCGVLPRTSVQIILSEIGTDYVMRFVIIAQSSGASCGRIGGTKMVRLMKVWSQKQSVSGMWTQKMKKIQLPNPIVIVSGNEFLGDKSVFFFDFSHFSQKSSEVWGKRICRFDIQLLRKDINWQKFLLG